MTFDSFVGGRSSPNAVRLWPLERVRQTLAANRALQTDALGSLLSPTPASTLLVVRRVKHIRRHLSTLRATMPRHLGGGRPSHHVVSLPLRRLGAEIIAIAASISSA